MENVGKSERRIPALAVSRGIGIGHVVFLPGEKRQPIRIDLAPSLIAAEVERFREATHTCSLQLKELSADDHLDPNQPVSNIFGVQLSMLEESSLIEKTEAIIRDQNLNAEWALKIVVDQYLEKLHSVSELHFKEKYLDIEDVCERLLIALGGSQLTVDGLYSGAVIVARELRPSTILGFAKGKPAGLITERGGWTSHASILAREFIIPMTSGIHDLEKTLCHGEYVIVDGFNGLLITNPTTETLEEYSRVVYADASPDRLTTNLGNCVSTLDNVEITIMANVDFPSAYGLAHQFGAQGIGLFRSESLITHAGKVPSEDAQMQSYSELSDVAGNTGVNIRTFDVGLDRLTGYDAPLETNPSLGLRSIRLSLEDPQYLRTQIRAILRASFQRKIDIVIPMVSGVSEIVRLKAILSEERLSLENDGVRIGEPKLGAMIEVPSGVLMAPEIARHVDFLSLGTNDLVQYLLAIDRDNDLVADWYQTLHPAVIRAIREVVSAAKTAGIPLVVCGEMAGSAFYVPLLIGLGVRQLSMNVTSIQQIRSLISSITLSALKSIVESVNACETADEVENVLRAFYLENLSDLFPPELLNSKHR